MTSVTTMTARQRLLAKAKPIPVPQGERVATVLCPKCGNLLDPPDTYCAACAAVAAGLRRKRIIDPWRLLQAGERRILDIQSGREWSAYADGSVCEWTTLNREVGANDRN